MVRKHLYQLFAGSLFIASSLTVSACQATYPLPMQGLPAYGDGPAYFDGSYDYGTGFYQSTGYADPNGYGSLYGGVYTAANQEYLNSLFSSLWAPDSKLIAIRAVTPSLETSGYGASSENQKASGHDLVAMFDPETGNNLGNWSLPTEVTRATHLSNFNSKQFAGLQWSADGQQLYVLQPKYSADKLLQSMVLYTLVPGRVDPSVREIFIPSSLKELSTLGFSMPSLSPQGDKVALYRRFRTDAGEQQEAILLNLNSSAIESRIPLSGSPLQDVGWSQDGRSQYIMTESQLNDQPQTNFLRIKDQKTETLFNLQAGLGSFVLSPDRKQVLVSFPKGATSATGQQPEAHLSDPSNSLLSLVYDLDTGKQVLFNPPSLALHASHERLERGISHEQLLWDHQDQLNYLSLPEPNQSNYGDPNFKWTIINPLQKSLQPGPDLKSTLDQLEITPNTILMPYSTETYLNRPSTPSVAAFSPRDSRVLLRIGKIDSEYTNAVFHVWNPANNQIHALKASFKEFKTAKGIAY